MAVPKLTVALIAEYEDLFARVVIRPERLTAVMAAAVVGIQEYLAFGAAGLEPLQEILWSVLVGAACYTTTCLVVWLLAGKPYGPEQEALRLIGAIRSRAIGKRKGVPGE